MTIYLDVLFMVNFLMDSILMGLAFFILRRLIKLHKIALYAAAMAVYGCFMFIPKISFLYSRGGRILITLGCIYLIFRPRTPGEYLKDTGAFFLVGFLMSGSIYALAGARCYQEQIEMLYRGSMIYVNISMPALIIGTAIAYLLLWALKKIYILNFSKDKILLTVSITLDDLTKKFVVLLDTGCTAAEPLTGRPLLVLGSEGEIFLPKCDMELPYVYAGGTAAMKGFYPTHAETEKSGYNLCGKICVGICETDFRDLPYQGVINPDAVREFAGQNQPKGEVAIEKEEILTGN